MDSAIGDFVHSAEHEVSAQVRTALEQELHHVLAALESVKADFSEKSSKEVAAVAVEALRQRMKQSPALQAAWRDLVKKASTEKRSAEQVALCRDLFIALMFRAGHGGNRLDLLDGVLDDLALSIGNARALLVKSPAVFGPDQL